MINFRFPDPNHRFVREIFHGDEYEFLQYYPTVIDIGANIGMFSAWMYDHSDKIYAIEPNAACVDNLKQLIDMNGLNKIEVRQLAISDSSVVKNMRAVGDPLNGAWRLDPAGDYPVHCLTLKDFFDKEGIEFADLVKMDVEGAELSIFKSDGFPKDRIGTMIGELHSDLHGQDEIRKVIEWLGFRYYIIPNNHFLARR